MEPQASAQKFKIITLVSCDVGTTLPVQVRVSLDTRSSGALYDELGGPSTVKAVLRDRGSKGSGDCVKMRSVNFIIPARFPTEKAYGVNILQSMKALSRHQIRVTYTTNCARGVWDSSMSRRHRESRWLSAMPRSRRSQFELLRALTLARSVPSSLRSDICWTRDPMSALILRYTGRFTVLELHQAPHRSLLGRLAKPAIRRRLRIFYSSELIRDEVGLVEPSLLGPVFPNAVSTAWDFRESAVSAAIARLREDGLRVVVLAGRHESSGNVKGWGAVREMLNRDLLPTDVALLVFGGSSEDAALAAKALDSSGLSRARNRLVVMPGIPHDAVMTALRSADGLLLAYGMDAHMHSPSPLKALEYAFSGTPIIASRTRNVLSILSEQTALLFDPDDANDLSLKIREAIEIPRAPSIESKVRRARDLAELWTWDSRCEAILDWINRPVPE